ncbi:uncharacterized protein PHALS_11050 [Plasmopara halstedii]|uniref:Uncharacterized protein n=1 Tax=Plasmopara halstedii TaxID=4781 RepID=A0A0P1AI59_PLAHL|nr:uncharacterized protein PHALS_11050 [Plasmopara halstedii]CEG40871.1 hypothetical protein PHALS_11050 [Plasmopara halstedii]|eukprot:XP_024577240.1 hypothetical protein PHALS_11050 [Plasmopara halstedii]
MKSFRKTKKISSGLPSGWPCEELCDDMKSQPFQLFCHMASVGDDHGFDVPSTKCGISTAVGILSFRQDSFTLNDYAQKLRELRASMASDPQPEAVMGSVFTEELTYDPPKTEVFYQNLTNLDDAKLIPFREEYCQRQARGQSVDPMEAVIATSENLELIDLSAVTVCRHQIRCYGS